MKRKRLPGKWNFLLGFVTACLLLSVNVHAQTSRRIQGTVIARAGSEPLVAATVAVKGTTNQVSTNEKGQFTINAGSNDVLVASSVGYDAKEIKVGNVNNVNITLDLSYNKLTDVVVVGYGRMKK